MQSEDGGHWHEGVGEIWRICDVDSSDKLLGPLWRDPQLHH